MLKIVNNYVQDCRLLLMSDQVFYSFLANICSEDGKIDPECFSPAQAFAFRVMDRMYVYCSITNSDPKYSTVDFHLLIY